MGERGGVVMCLTQIFNKRYMYFGSAKIYSLYTDYCTAMCTLTYRNPAEKNEDSAYS